MRFLRLALLALGVAIACPVQAQKISEMPAGSALTGDELAPFVQSGSTVKITAGQIRAFNYNGALADNEVPRAHSTQGALQSSGVTVDDDGNVTATGYFVGVLPGYDIEQCGAVAGDSSAGVKTANAAAIVACWNDHQDLYVPAGVFYTDAVTAPSNARSISGVDSYTSIIRGTITTGSLLTQSNAVPFNVEKIGFELPNDDDSYTAIAINVSNVTSGHIAWNRFNAPQAVTANPLSNFRIEKNIIEAWHVRAFNIFNGTNIKIDDNDIRDYTSVNVPTASVLQGISHTIGISKCDGLSISGNTFGKVAALAIQLSGARRAKINDNKVLKAKFGEKLAISGGAAYDSFNIEVADNIFDWSVEADAEDFAFDIQADTDGDIYNVLFSNNTFIRSGYGAFVGQFGGGTGTISAITLDGNTFRDIGTGIALTGAAAWFGAALQVEAGVSALTFSNNHMTDTTGSMTAWVWNVSAGSTVVAFGNSGTAGTTSNYVLQANDRVLDHSKVYQNSTSTSPAFTIEQDSTGDAQLQWLLTGGQAWIAGIDNSDSDKFKLSSADDGFAAPWLGITPAGAVTWGSGNFTTETYSGAGAIDMTWNYATSNTAILTQSDAGAAGPVFRGFHNSASPAASDVVFAFEGYGKDSAGNDQLYGRMSFNITDTTAGSEDGTFTLNGVLNGAQDSSLSVGNGIVVRFNLLPFSNNSVPIGSTTLQFADLFLAEGGVINFDNGDATITQTGNSVAVAGGLLATPSHALTIATGAVTATQSYAVIDTESAGASDDLDTINGGVSGAILYVSAANAARTVVIKDGTGNIQGPGDCTLDNDQDIAQLLYNSTLSAWLVVACGNNGA